MKNETGLYPIKYQVLVLLDKMKEKTDGGIYYTDKTREQEGWASQKGTLIAVGGNAFEDMKPPTPVIGQRIYCARYAGNNVESKDGKTYQLMNDQEVVCIIEEKGK